MLWAYLSFFVAFSSALQVFLYKILSVKYKNVENYILTIFIFTGFLSLLILLSKGENPKKFIDKYVLIICILLFVGRLMFVKAISLSPNPGYAHLIVNTNVILTLIFCYIFLNKKLNINTFFGLILTLLGIFIVIYNS